MSAIFEFHLASETLNSEEVAEISGCQRRADQIAWLNRAGWLYHTNKAGLPVIGRMYARLKMAGINPAALASPAASGWQAVYATAATELQDAMDLNYLSGQRPGDVLRMKDADIREGALHVRQGKTNKFLRILLKPNDVESELAKVIARIQGRPGRQKGAHLVALPNGDAVKQWNLRLRFDTARASAVKAAEDTGKKDLAKRIKQFQFRDIRAKSASEISDTKAASELLGHTEVDITDRVYRRVGQAVTPTR